MEILQKYDSRSPSESSVWKCAFSYFIWFCLGILATFGFKIHEKSLKVFKIIFKLNTLDTLSFGFNSEIISVSLYFAGLILAYIFFPTSLIWLEILLYFTVFMYLGMIIPSRMLVTNSTAISKEGIKYFFYVTNAGASLGIGTITMTGLTLITDRFVPGKTQMKLLFLLLGYPFAEMATIFAEGFISFTPYDQIVNAFGTNLAKFLAYKLSIFIILVLMTSIMIIFFTKFKDGDHRIWMKFNAINKNKMSLRALRLLGGQIKSIVVLFISNSISGLFTIISLFYLVSLYGSGTDISFGHVKLLLFKCVFELVGRIIPCLFGICLERPRTSTHENQEDRSVVKRVICCILSPMLLVYILVITEVAIIIITVFAVAKGTDEVFKSSLLSYNTGVFLASFIGLVRGLTVSLVLYRASNVKVNHGLIDDDVLMVYDVNLVKSFVLGIFLFVDALTIIINTIFKLFIEGLIVGSQIKAGQPSTFAQF